MRYSLLAMTRSVIVLFASFLAAAAGAPSHSPVGTWAWPAAGYSCVDPWVKLSERDVTYLGNGLWTVHVASLARGQVAYGEVRVCDVQPC